MTVCGAGRVWDVVKSNYAITILLLFSSQRADITAQVTGQINKQQQVRVWVRDESVQLRSLWAWWSATRALKKITLLENNMCKPVTSALLVQLLLNVLSFYHLILYNWPNMTWHCVYLYISRIYNNFHLTKTSLVPPTEEKKLLSSLIFNNQRWRKLLQKRQRPFFPTIASVPQFYMQLFFFL